MSDALKTKILELFENQKTGTLATIQDQKPYSRFMLFFHDDLTLYTATNKETHKVDDIGQEPNVHILLGAQDANPSGAYCEIEATASIEDSKDKKEKYWDDSLSKWLGGPNDPNYVLLQLKPQKIRYFADSASKAEVLEL
ncbi:pyridoxamine 5'-phosphate oxidase family protein [Niallia taxi]|nr:pyridoxamine 5'-phosphate oxidase family protein [Niallia taxi]MDE5055536.1 pyridoxamine 5'-phosphate oxidase family protein [Niallia taxi]